MAKEIERVGIPTAYYTAIPTIPQAVGTPRIIAGKAVTSPLGDPALPPEREFRYRRRLVERGLEVLQTAVSGPTVFTLERET